MAEAIRRQSEEVNGGPARPIRECLMLLFGLCQQREKKKRIREKKHVRARVKVRPL